MQKKKRSQILAHKQLFKTKEHHNFKAEIKRLNEKLFEETFKARNLERMYRDEFTNKLLWQQRLEQMKKASQNEVIKLN